MAKRKDNFESKYFGIARLLERNGDKKEIVLSFNQIEKEIGKLPKSAKKYHTWWANNRTPKAPCRHSRIWISKGFLTRFVNLKKGEVTFVKAKTLKKKPSRAEVILKACRDFLNEGKKSFTRKEIVIKIANLFPKVDFKITSIDAAIQAMKENSKSAKLVGRSWRDTLKHLKRGYFTLTQKGLKAKKSKLRVKINRSDKEKIKEKLEEEFKIKFLKKNLKVDGKTKIPLDLISEDKKIAVKFYKIKEKKVNVQSKTFSKIIQNLESLKKAKIKSPIIVLKRSKQRKKDKQKFIREIKSLFKGVNLYLYEKNNFLKTSNLIKL